MLLPSCRLTDKLFNGEVVARVQGDLLYKKDLKGLIPENASPEDSAHIITSYIHSWAKEELILYMAEKELSHEELDVSKELEKYRRSLLVYRYQKSYVSEKLDTVVTNDELNLYYNNHPQSFTYNESIVKARYIKISTDSPNLSVIKKLYLSDDVNDYSRLTDLCYVSADKYIDFDDEWISISVICRELLIDIPSIEEALDKRDYIEKESKGALYLVYVRKRIAPNELSPFEYNKARIKEIILNKRKNELLVNLGRNLLKDALNKDKVIIYTRENNE